MVVLCYNKVSERDREPTEPSRLDLAFQEGSRGRASTLQTAEFGGEGGILNEYDS